MNTRSLLLLLIILIDASCQSAKHSFQSGDFESAIAKAVNKLKKNPQDDESKIYLEAAYDKLYYQTMDQVTFLKKEGRPENVLGVYDNLSQLKLYESMVAPLLPLYI